MSKLEQLSGGSCSACGEQVDVEYWSSINVGLDPDLKDGLLNYKVNLFECPKCKAKSLLPFDLLYHDMEKKLWFQLTFSEDVDAAIAQQNKTLEELNSMVGENFKQVGYNRRLVCSYSDLVEKIRIFDEGLDDRVIEFMKMTLQMKERAIQNEVDDKLYFTGVMEHPENPGTDIIVFNNSWYAPVKEWYEPMKGTISSTLGDTEEGICVIDQKFALGLFEFIKKRNVEQ